LHASLSSSQQGRHKIGHYEVRGACAVFRIG
jgi:hypothetical protein